MRPSPLRLSLFASACLLGISAQAQSKPPITLDEFMNTTEISEAHLSPDGSSALIATETPDWKANNFRHDLWLWSAAAGLRPLTHSGSEESAQWSPDGKWIAFLSDRSLSGEPSGTDSDDAKADRLWLIPVAGGEALPLYREKLDVHAFAWSADSASLYYAVTLPLTHDQEETQKADWKDVIRWREQHRGDLILSQPVAPALARALAVEGPGKATAEAKTSDDKNAGKSKEESATNLPAGAETLTKSPISITEISPSPDGKSIAFVTGPVHHRIESPADYEIFLVPATGGESRQLTHNDAVENLLHWSPDSSKLYFSVQAAAGSLEGKYHDVQGRLYWMDPANGKITRLGVSLTGSPFNGSWDNFTILPDGRLLALGLQGTETQLYLIEGDKATKLPGLPGTYTGLESARNAGAIMVRHSAINRPTQAYIAADPLHPDQLTPLTAFNPIFAQRAQPDWQPYTWKADDGRTVEGVLIFPPGQ